MPNKCNVCGHELDKLDESIFSKSILKHYEEKINELTKDITYINSFLNVLKDDISTHYVDVDGIEKPFSTVTKVQDLCVKYLTLKEKLAKHEF